MAPCDGRLLLPLVAAILIPTVSGLKCYACAGCAEPYRRPDNDVIEKLLQLVPCTVCVKSWVGDVVTRTCAPLGSDIESGCQTTGADSGICHCDTDYCNRTPPPQQYTPTTVFTAILLARLASMYLTS